MPLHQSNDTPPQVGVNVNYVLHLGTHLTIMMAVKLTEYDTIGGHRSWPIIIECWDSVCLLFMHNNNEASLGYCH